MPKLSKRVMHRISSGLKRFQPILAAAKSRDVHESDTSIIVTDILSGIFGYDKYSEITSEFMIRGTYCDLAVKMEGIPRLLIEVKAIGLDLKEQFVKQAVDYAANLGIEWVALTNGAVWQVYKVVFGQPIQRELVVDFDLMAMDHRKREHIETLSLLAKESWQKANLSEYYTQKQALSRFILGALILSEPVLDVLRREIKRLAPGVRVDAHEIKAALASDVLKREVLEGEQAESARKQVAKASGRLIRGRRSSTTRAVPNRGNEFPSAQSPEEIP
jgi:predicted type IV restriction endonuclease